MERFGNFINGMETGKRWIDAVCEVHGAYVSRLYFRQTWSACPGCVEDDYAAKRESFERAERVAALERWQSIAGAAGVPAAYADSTFDNYKPTNAEAAAVLIAARGYSDNLTRAIAQGQNAVFFGSKGTGKTHLICATVTRALADSRSALFLSASKVFRRVRDTWGRASAQTESEVIAALAAVELLAIDEVQETTDQERGWLFDVINDRYEAGRPTILGTNLDLKNLTIAIGERAADRLRDRGSLVFRCAWESYRGQSGS
jgi:DNA replication protein DnaC